MEKSLLDLIKQSTGIEEVQKMERSLLQKLDEYNQSAIGKSNKEFFDKIDRYELKIEKFNNELQRLTDEQFETLLRKEFELHGDAWTNKCYNDNVEPYPQENLQCIIDVMHSYYENSKEEDFSVYKGIKVENIYGQGVITEFSKNGEFIFSI